MQCINGDGHLLIDTMISLVVVSLITTALFRYYIITSDSARFLYINHQRLHNVLQVMDLALQGQTKVFSLKKDISVHCMPLTPNTIQKKPHNYSFDFETNFTFIVVTEDHENVKQNTKPLMIVSGVSRVQQ